jgi:hypothetical protein
LWEKLTCLPNHGSLPQTSQRYDMTGKPPEAAGECTSVWSHDGKRWGAGSVKQTGPPSEMHGNDNKS